MKKTNAKIKLYSFLVIFMFFNTFGARATPMTLVESQATWNYNTTIMDLWPNFTTLSFTDFINEYTGANTGQAGFGNASVGATAPNTAWAANTDLALQTTFDLAGTVNGNATMNVAIDNGAIVFINGVKAFSANAEGFTSFWEYTASIAGNLFVVGTNTISVFAEDHGGLTYFDMQLIADDGVNIFAVPEGNSLALFGVGLLGLCLIRRTTAVAIKRY